MNVSILLELEIISPPPNHPNKKNKNGKPNEFNKKTFRRFNKR